jgi:RNA polymerase sigma-70 factor, ECF subfamily
MPRRRDGEFEQTVLPHSRSLFRFALRLTRNRPAAEDLVQEALMLAWRGFTQLKDDSHARAWVFGILINAFRTQNRKARSSPELLDLTTATGSASGPGVESLDVSQALNRLATDHRTVLLLAVVEGFTCREISGILSLPMGTVMSRLSRARDALRAALLQDERVAR